MMMLLSLISCMDDYTNDTIGTGKLSRIQDPTLRYIAYFIVCGITAKNGHTNNVGSNIYSRMRDANPNVRGYYNLGAIVARHIQNTGLRSKTFGCGGFATLCANKLRIPIRDDMLASGETTLDEVVMRKTTYLSTKLILEILFIAFAQRRLLMTSASQYHSCSAP